MIGVQSGQVVQVTTESNGVAAGFRGAGHVVHGKFIHGITFLTEFRVSFRREVSYTPAAPPWQKFPVVLLSGCDLNQARIDSRANSEHSAKPVRNRQAASTELP